MKKLFILLLFIFLSETVSAQISNLEELASGKLELFKPIIDLNEKIHGYIAIFRLEKTKDKKIRFEYVFLDRNLNKVANGEFKDVNYRSLKYEFYYPEKVGGKLIITKRYYHKVNKMITYTSHRILDLRQNTISKEFYFDGTKYVEGYWNEAKAIKALRRSKKIDFPITIGDNFLNAQYSKVSKNKDIPTKIEAFNIQKEPIWDYTFNPDKEKVEKIFNLFGKKHLIMSVFKEDRIYIHAINPSNGELLFKYELQDGASEYAHMYSVKSVNDTFVIVGKISQFNIYNGYYSDDLSLGLFRIVLDSKGKEISKDYFLWRDAQPYLKMDKFGVIKKGKYKLSVKSYFAFNDGTVSILTEKRKPGSKGLLGSSTKTTDFAILNFDKDFTLLNIHTIEKDKTKNGYSDFLYSQRIKKGNGVVVFYNDYKKNKDTKEKNWILGIVTIINGKINHEQIPMSSKEHFLLPYVAKEGYILLREFNKNEEFNQIRLERLNY